MLSQKCNIKLAEFKNREVVFLPAKGFGKKEKKEHSFRGHTISSSENIEVLKKLLRLENKTYNSYVSIMTYSKMPRFPLNFTKHAKLFKEWWKEKRLDSIVKCDMFLDFDGEATIEGTIKTWEDVKIALDTLPELIGEQAKYLRVFYSGNKGFHILGKCKIDTTIKDLLLKQQDIADKLSILAPSVDTCIYDPARLRKLIGSVVYSKTFGKTRVIPVSNDKEFKELLIALETKDEEWFNNKPLSATHSVINSIDLSKYKIKNGGEQ